MREWGYGVAGLGVVILLFALTMNTAVETEFGSVNNLGLMNDKQNYIILGGFVMLIGIVMALFGGSNESQPESDATINNHIRKCPACAELVSREAVKCKHCGDKLNPEVRACSYCGLKIADPIMPCDKFSADEIEASSESIKSPRCKSELVERGLLQT